MTQNTAKQTVADFLSKGGQVTKLPKARPQSNRTFRKVRNAKTLRARPAV